MKSAFDNGNLPLSWKIANDDVKSITDDIDHLRVSLLAEAKKISAVDIPKDGMARRWFIQRCRCVFNRLVYLSSPEEYHYYLPNIDELAELRNVIKFLQGDHYRSLLDFPGAASRTVGEIMSRTGRVFKVDISKSDLEESSPTLEAMINMRLWNAIDIRGSGSEQVPVLRALENHITKRILNDFSYNDELESLITPKSEEERLTYISDRYSNKEYVLTEATRLDGGYSG